MNVLVLLRKEIIDFQSRKNQALTSIVNAISQNYQQPKNH